jgi:hypothetical protein
MTRTSPSPRPSCAKVANANTSPKHEMAAQTPTEAFEEKLQALGFKGKPTYEQPRARGFVEIEPSGRYTMRMRKGS